MYQSLENSICRVFPFQRNVCVTRCVTQLLVDSRSQCLLLNVTLSEQHSLPDRLVINNTSYSLFFKGLLFRSLHCKTGKSFYTPLSQWASFLHDKQDVNSCWTCPIAWSYIEANIHDYNWTEMFCERMLLLSAVLGLLFVLQCPSTSGKRVKYLHSHTEYINFI